MTRLRWGYPILGICLFALYLPTLARGVTFSDGPEIVTAITTLGVIHPTGYPIFTVLAHAFTRLLPSSIPACARIEILNALFGAGAAVLTARAAREICLRIDPDRSRAALRDVDLASLASGLLLGLSPLLWEQIRIPEVYPFHCFLVAWAGYLWVRFEVTDRQRYILAAALPMGIGLAHHVTMVYMLPAAFVYLLVRKPWFVVSWLVWPVARIGRIFKPGFLAKRGFEGAWGFPVACLIGFLPLLSYGYLIWANGHTTGLPWGNVNDWDNLYAHMTGRQYQRFMASGTVTSHWNRLRAVPGFFDEQFLPPGTLLFFVGAAVLWRRLWKAALFLSAFLIFNVAHSVHYSVGDYANYYIPGLFPCAVLIGAGLAWLAARARARRPEDRAWLSAAAASAMLATAAILVVAYAYLTKRLPAPIAPTAPLTLGVPLGVLALVLAVAAIVWRRRRKTRPRAVSAALLPLILTGGLAASLAPIGAARALSIASHALVGEGYGAELADNIPPGSVLMTQGDGHLFTMWYEAHVLGKGRDFATIDLGNVRTSWYQRYVQSHFPSACDPLAGRFGPDPGGYERECKTFEQRMAMRSSEPWVSMGIKGPRAGTAKEMSLPFTIVRGADPRCEDAKFRADHKAAECGCWGYADRRGTLGEDCVYSAEEGGIVRRDSVDIFAQRIIEDHIDERPVFERNTLTNWGGTKDTRQWEGPSYQRVSGEYAIVNRGRYNQIVYADDLKGLDPCAGQKVRPIALRGLERAGSKPKGPDRRKPYKPNPFPTLLSASFLAPTAAGGDDDATRVFGMESAVFLKIDWFEKNRYDPAKRDHKGAPIRHRLRVCVFDPEGERVARVEATSGKKEAIPLIEAGGLRPGRYMVQACTAGEGADLPAPLPEDVGCQRIVLEYRFTVRGPE